MPSSKCKLCHIHWFHNGEINKSQGLEEVDILLLRGLVHQLQLARNGPVQDIQDEDLDVSY